MLTSHKTYSILTSLNKKCYLKVNSVIRGKQFFTQNGKKLFRKRKFNLKGVIIQGKLAENGHDIDYVSIVLYTFLYIYCFHISKLPREFSRFSILCKLQSLTVTFVFSLVINLLFVLFVLINIEYLTPTL